MRDLYTISGTVVRGEKYGHTLGYPTANLAVETTDIPQGVYGGTVTRSSDKKTYKAGIVIWHDPIKIEAHLLDFKGDLYGETLTIHIKVFIRDVKVYKPEEIETLKRDIKNDLEKIRALL